MSEKKLTENKEASTRPISIYLLARIFLTIGKYFYTILFANFLLFICLFADQEINVEIGKILDRTDLKTASFFGIVGYLGLLCLLNRIFGSMQFLITILTTNQITANLRKVFFDRLTVLSKRFYDNHKIGWLVARSTGDMGSIWDFSTFALMSIMLCLGSISISFYNIGNIKPILLLPCLGIIPFTFIATLLFRKKMTENQRELREANSKMIGYISECIRGIRVTQAFSREQLNNKIFGDHNQKNYNLGIQASRINGLYLPTIELIGVMGLVSAMIFGVYLIESTQTNGGASTISPGDLAAYLLFINVILFPVRILVELYSMSISAMASAERIYEIIDLEEDVKNPKISQPVDLNSVHIEFQNVSFRYKEDSADILKNFNLTIRNNETIALVGETGSGKTTIATLLARFYDVSDGEISINGNNIKNYNQDELHSNMGIVLQEGYLYSGSILENLKFRNPQLSDEAVYDFCKKLGIHDMVASLPNSYQTLVGEGGHAVSHGQRQLISLTRALITNPKLMIFDEATSSIDVLTESILTKAIEKISKSTTTIIIAHRLSTVKNADRILVIGNGGILEEGKYNELVAKNGHFAKLVIH